MAAIRKMLDEGKVREAEGAMEDLLFLGPSNIDALKLKAMIFAAEGRFVEEERVWNQIFRINDDDPDAIAYIHRRHLEDREHYYFTDDLPGGGRRFLAYPRALISISVWGLMGSMAFLLLTRLSDRIPILAAPKAILLSFLGLVISPWVAIMVSYCRSIRSIEVSPAGIGFATRLKAMHLPWPDLEQVCLAYADDPQDPDLRLVVIPRDPARPAIELDLNEHTSPIRARLHLLDEIALHYGPLKHEPRQNLGLRPKGPILYR